MLKSVILCGGVGTRLWPLSRKLYPKQFLNLLDGESLYQQTIRRHLNICDEFLIIANQEQYFLALDQMDHLKEKTKCSFLLEPIGRNTAPAIILAALMSQPDDILIISPSDHFIGKIEDYQKTILRAVELAQTENLVTIGINPDHPHTGYGYIQFKNDDVISFKEKPNIEMATTFFQSKDYLWNAGIFCFKAKTLLAEAALHAPTILSACQNAISKTSEEPYRIALALMEQIPSDSIDYALFEKSQKVKVVKADFQWSDLGSFDALYESMAKDKDGNTLADKIISIDSRNNLILNEDKIISLININDLIVVNTPDAILVTPRGRSQRVKELIPLLDQTNTELTTIHVTAHRPWGTYTILEDSPSYKVKRIMVRPKGKLSLQKHFHRSEHWVVVKGEATVTINDKTFVLKSNESCYIPKEAVHRLHNQTEQELILIEAQVGTYLGEDDIVRIEDDYKRN